MQVWQSSIVTVLEQKISKNNFCAESLKHVSVLRKKYVQLYKWSFSFFRTQNTRAFAFLLVLDWERLRITVWEQKNFKHIFLIRNLRQASIYCKKVFLLNKLRVSFVVSPLKTQNFLFLQNPIDRSKITVFNKNVTRISLAIKILGKRLLTVKNYFQMHKLRSSFVGSQNTQIFSFLLYLHWEKSKATVLQWQLFKNKFLL